MKDYLFDPLGLSSGKIFPPCIESREWTVYHGTSSYYSPDIEKYGFRRQRPVPISDLERVIEIGKRLAVDTSSVAEYLNLSSISFTPVSAVALFFVRAESYGGQGLLHSMRLIDEICDKKDTLLEPGERDHLGSLRKKIAMIREPPAVIYAVNVEDVRQMAYSDIPPSLAALHVYADLPAERIVAKMQLDAPAYCDEATKKRLLEQFGRYILGNRSHWLRRINAMSADGDSPPPTG